MSDSEQARFRLRPAQRIKRGADFRVMRESGLRQEGGCFLLSARPRGDTKPARIGIVVSRFVGNAVTRNLIKRHFREIFRRNQHAIPDGFDLVVVARPAATKTDQAGLEKRFLKLIGKLGEKIQP